MKRTVHSWFHLLLTCCTATFFQAVLVPPWVLHFSTRIQQQFKKQSACPPPFKLITNSRWDAVFTLESYCTPFQGDSGGPMLIQVDNSYIMAGIVSFGKKCGLKDVSGVYTRAGLYTAWVFQHTLDASCKPAFTDSPNYPDSEYQDLSKPTLPPVISNNNV